MLWFFYHKLGNGTFLTDYLLQGSYIVGSPPITIYFGTVPTADFLALWGQYRDFHAALLGI